MDVKKLLETAIRNVEDSRPRTLQVALGPSAAGGCERRAWLQLKGAPEVNVTEQMPAWMGSGIHALIAEGMEMENTFGDRYLIEHKVERDGLVGNCDLFDTQEGAVVDWKSTKKNGLRYFPKPQQIWQVQLYGWMLSGMGHTVNTVSLAAIPRDGVLGDVKIHTEPYDESVALEALEWLRRVQASEEMPEPIDLSGKPMNEKNLCMAYCPFWSVDGSVCPR